MQERRGLVAACVMNCNRERRERFGFGDETLRIIRVRRIASDEGSLGARVLQFLRCFFEFLGIAACDYHRMSSTPETPGNGRAQSARRTDADHKHARL